MERSDKVLAGLFAIRLITAYSPLHDVLKLDEQLASPLTSYSRCEQVVFSAKYPFDLDTLVLEGVYLFKNEINPYSGGVFRHVC